MALRRSLLQYAVERTAVVAAAEFLQGNLSLYQNVP
jgi:hypothetical protein